jgi:hypothetical protein
MIVFGAGQWTLFSREMIFFPTTQQSVISPSTSVISQIPAASIANRQEKERAFETRTIAVPVAPQLNRASETSNQISNTAATPPMRDVPLPRPRPKF